MKKTFLASLAVVIISCGVIGFIYVSNDHSECETISYNEYGNDGEKRTTETHVCKEKYNF